MTDHIRVLVVDDSAYSRRTIADILESTGICQVIGMARDGEDGIKKALDLKPDLVTLDLEMPKMDGFTFLRILMKSMPIPVLVISSMAHRRNVFRAMEMGAIDFLAKPNPSIGDDLYDIKEDLINKVEIVGQLQMLNIQRRLKRTPAEELLEPSTAAPRVKEKVRESRFSCIVIGSSTGGPSALQEILSSLPGDISLGIAISQHMPAGFTRAFAERLDKYSAWDIKEAEEGERLDRGMALVAPGGYHMALVKGGTRPKVRLSKRQPEDKYVPSVDVLFKSAAKIYGSELLAVVLTGMGNDGTEGAIEIKKRGGKVFAESAETAIVYGMPREATECGAAERNIPLDKMAKEIIRTVAPKTASDVPAIKKTKTSRMK